MKREQGWIAHWKSGIGILIRLVVLSMLANVVLLPIRFLGNWIEPGTVPANIVAGVYLIMIVPLTLPEMIRICGLRKTRVDEIDGLGGMNKASKRKMLELKAERPSKRPEKDENLNNQTNCVIDMDSSVNATNLMSNAGDDFSA